MRCDEFINKVNQVLDDRSSNHDELLEHTRRCRTCRKAWESLQHCEQTLVQTRFKADEHLTERVLRQTKRRAQLQLQRKLVVATSFAATVVAGLLALAAAVSTSTTSQEPAGMTEVTQTQIAATEPARNWSQWYVDTDLPTVNEIWNSSWPTDGLDTSMATSVSSGLRPVAATMSSAFKVIRQNVLPTTRQPVADDGQAGTYVLVHTIA